MGTQNTMEEKKTITIEEVKNAIQLLRTYAMQHEGSAMLVAISSGADLGLCHCGCLYRIGNLLALYAVASENIKRVILDTADMLLDDSEEGQEFLAKLKTVTEGAVGEQKILG